MVFYKSHTQTISMCKILNDLPLSFTSSISTSVWGIHNVWISLIRHICMSSTEGSLDSAHYPNRLCIEYHSRLNLQHHNRSQLPLQKNHLRLPSSHHLIARNWGYFESLLTLHFFHLLISQGNSFVFCYLSCPN